MGKRVPKYLKEDFPNGGHSGAGGCKQLIQKVGDEAKNNILHPGYPAEILDKQIKEAFKNMTALDRVKRRKRNQALLKTQEMQRAVLMNQGSLHESTIQMNHNPYSSSAAINFTSNSIEDLNQPVLVENSLEEDPNKLNTIKENFESPYYDIKSGQG